MEAANQSLPFRVLHVDDDQDDRDFLALAIKKVESPIELTSVNSCLDLINLMENERVFDLILMDVNMPVINGIDCLKRIKTNEKYNHIPVVIFTISYSPIDVEEAYQAGAHYYVIKPFSILNFTSAVQKIFEQDWKVNPPVPDRYDFVINYAFI